MPVVNHLQEEKKMLVNMWLKKTTPTHTIVLKMTNKKAGSFDASVDRVKSNKKNNRKSHITSRLSGGNRTNASLEVPLGGGSAVKRSSHASKSSNLSAAKQRTKSASSVGSGGSSIGSSGGGSGSDLTSRRKKRRKAKKKDKKDNMLTRFRDYIAESDVFVEHGKRAPHLTCIYLGIWTIPVYAVILSWDTLAATAFEMPHLSMIEFPGFMLIFQFCSILLSMYGYSVQFVCSGSKNHHVTMAKIGLIFQYLLFFWRVFIELYFDGYRFQEKGYLPRSKSDMPDRKED